MTNDLLKELPTLLEKPNSQSVQLKHIEILSKIKYLLLFEFESFVMNWCNHF